jgi:uncharacterized protein (TIGR00290 family)
VEGIALSWSGGKDSSLALWTLRQQNLEPRALITTSSEVFDRISHHGVRRSLLTLQAERLGIELVEVLLPSPCSMQQYEQRLERAFTEAVFAEIETVAFGDIFLEDLRAYRESKLAGAGRAAVFPLWNRDTTELAHEFIDAGFEAIVVSLDPDKLDPSFAGRAFDRELLDDLPPEVDPCGENGDFHTFVHAGPIFAHPISCSRGEVVRRDGLVFCDLVPRRDEVVSPRGQCGDSSDLETKWCTRPRPLTAREPTANCPPRQLSFREISREVTGESGR